MPRHNPTEDAILLLERLGHSVLSDVTDEEARQYDAWRTTRRILDAANNSKHSAHQAV